MMNKYNILATLIIISSFIFSLLIFNGLIDAFAPKQITQIESTIETSFLDENSNMVEQIPGFYAFGALLKLVTNVSGYDLLFYPIQIIPYFIIVFIFINKLSDSIIYSSIITALQLLGGTTGTAKFFFWPHGIGGIIFYTALVILVELIATDKHRSEYKLLFLIAGVSLIFISYNYYLILVILLIVYMTMTIIYNKLYLTYNIYNDLSRLSIILIISQLGLCNFVYKALLPTLKNEIEISGFDKLILSYAQLSTSVDDPIISNLLIRYDETITIISLIKYTILVIYIILFIYIVIRMLKSSYEIPLHDQLVFSFIIVYFVYALARISVGEIGVNYIFFPGVLCAIRLYRYDHLKLFIYISSLILLVLTLTYTISMNNTVPSNNIHYTDYIEQSSGWYIQYKDPDITSASDEFTRNLFSFYIFNNFYESHTIPIIRIGLITDLLQNQGPRNDRYIIINYKCSAMSIQNWRIIKSWIYSVERINNNHYIDKVYDNIYLSIYF